MDNTIIKMVGNYEIVSYSTCYGSLHALNPLKAPPVGYFEHVMHQQ